MVEFVPSVWKVEGEKVSGAADEFYRGAHGVITCREFRTRSSSPIEQAVANGDALCYHPWHHLIASSYEGLTSVASRMVATGSDYAATEEAAASVRFWQ